MALHIQWTTRKYSTVIGLHHTALTEKENEKINSYNLSTSILSIIKRILKIITLNSNVIVKQNSLNDNNYNKNQGNNYFIADFSITDQLVYQNILKLLIHMNKIKEKIKI